MKGTTLQPLQNRMGALEGARLCGVVTAIEIEDARDSVSDRAIRIPTFSTGRQRDTIRPALSEDLRQIIRAELTRRINGGSTEYRVRVRVLDGIQAYRARRLSEEETARWETEVSLQGPRRTVSATGGLEYFVSSRDASRSFSDTLSNRVLQLSVAEAFRTASALIIRQGGGGCAEVRSTDARQSLNDVPIVPAAPRGERRENSRRAVTRGRSSRGLYGLRDQPAIFLLSRAADPSGWDHT
ncbi:MAG TPA: hypothetical protein VF647_02025 [Longimicrobium sp.]